MRVDGKAIADTILASLASEVVVLQQKGATPTLAVIQIGHDPGSTAYIRQKQKAVEAIGAKILIRQESQVISPLKLHNIIEEFNNDPAVHGIIVQRPLPVGMRSDGILAKKDVDGFLPHSPFPVPVAAAVLKIIEFAFSASRITHHALTTKQIVVIGRGETAGKPIANALIKKGCNVTVVHSQTPNPDEVIRTADIVISCVGKPNIVRRDNVKNGAVLISVGIWRDSEGKLHGDYEQDQINDVASFYTPTPGGVGPMNVACLMTNLVQAANNLL